MSDENSEEEIENLVSRSTQTEENEFVSTNTQTENDNFVSIHTQTEDQEMTTLHDNITQTDYDDFKKYVMNEMTMLKGENIQTDFEEFKKYIMNEVAMLKGEIFQNDYSEFKTFIMNEVAISKAAITSLANAKDSEVTDSIKTKIENQILKKELQNYSKWNTIPFKHVNSKSYERESTNNNIHLRNHFQKLPIQEQYERDYEEEPIQLSDSQSQSSANGSKQHIHHRPSVCITEKYVNDAKSHIHMKTVPGNQSYSDKVRSGKKRYVIGDSHVSRINRRLFQNAIVNGRAYIKPFSGVTSKQLQYHILPTLTDENPDVVLIHVGTNDITKFNRESVDPNVVAQNIVNIADSCKSHGVNEVFISSILTRNDFKLNEMIGQTNHFLEQLCHQKGYTYICNDKIKREHLYRDGIHLNADGTKILSNNFLRHININIDEF